ncbi:hypothetical protein J6590_078929 [Homalodisca vitripennis]|nr:hypothetical protein J6590_078929 [Homalodisca vitripennis]
MTAMQANFLRNYQVPPLRAPASSVLKWLLSLVRSVLAVCYCFMKQTLLQVFSVDFAQNTEETLQASLLFKVGTRILSRQVVVFVMRNRQFAHRLVMLLSNRSGKPLSVVLKHQRGVQLWRLEFHKRQFSECYGVVCT